MEISSILLLLAVVILVGIYLYAPLTQNAKKIRSGESHELSALKAERDRVINSLQELDFDNNLGKVPVEDYPAQRAALLQKGADILRRLDELTPAVPMQKNAEARIEKAAAQAHTDPAMNDESGMSDDEIESMIAMRRKQHKGKSAGFCPKCGKPVLVTDKFCPSCGKSLQ
jgi:rubrerythrin